MFTVHKLIWRATRLHGQRTSKKMVSILVDAIDKSENLEPVNQMYMTYDPVKAQRVGSAMDYNTIMTSARLHPVILQLRHGLKFVSAKKIWVM